MLHVCCFAVLHSDEGTDVDHDKATYWYHKAASAGYSGAQYDLAKIYERGDLGLEKDKSKADALFRRYTMTADDSK